MPRSKKSTAATSSTVDTISSLPDAILCHIISFVTTKEAVATSILSKRWIHLWHHVPNLNFPYFNVDTFGSILLFNEFVYSVLLSRETPGSNVIKGFNLKIQYDNPNLAYSLGLPNITQWINFVVQRKLEYLRLHLHVDDNLDDDDDEEEEYEEDDFYNLPVSIFTCRTLVSLDLRLFQVEGFCFSSNEFQFPSLKILRLDFVIFSEVRDFMLFIAGCPILEDLRISEMVLSAEEDSLILQEFKTLSLPKLIRADIVGFHCPCFPLNGTFYFQGSVHTYIEGCRTFDHRRPQSV
ncbi:FBD-associated F-box protein [Trifolium repens]|nr:FBD-associated F-box protein [Trifolium repens]